MSLLPTPTRQDGANTGGPSQAARNTPPLNSVAVRLMPTPKASDGPNGGPGMRNGRGDADALPGIVHLLPTPAVNDMGAGKTPPQWDEWTDRMRTEHSNGNGHGKSLAIEAQRLIGTPTEPNLGMVLNESTDFGPYTPAIRRWEHALGRPAPSPTEPGREGKPRLSPAFVEWLMGLPAGWVTDTDIPRSAQLKALGNGIVPQQAALAIRLLMGMDAAPPTHSGRTLPTPTVADTRDGSKARQMATDAMKRGASKGVNLNHLFENDELHRFHMERDA